MLAAPPAAAITYVKDSSGLEPSEYAGGGSLSLSSLEDSFVSLGRAALVSATMSGAGAGSESASLATGAYAGTDAEVPASVTAVLYASTASAVDL